MFQPGLTVLLLFVLILSSSVANADPEQYDRNVDRVALASEEKAISKLSNLLNKYHGTPQEPSLLLKLSEFQQQNSAIFFRIAHGMAHDGKKSLDLQLYHKELHALIKTLSTLIAKYPHTEEITQAYAMRGKAYEEINQKSAATRDYLELIHNHPNSSEAIQAHMSLAEFAIEANQYAQAVFFLNGVENRPENPHYPFALYKLAWAHYNLQNIPLALAYTERHVQFYKDSKIHSDEALRENMLLDSTIFLFDGYEKNISGCKISEALHYFKKLENGPVLGKMILRFSKLLRSHDHETDLITWKDQVLLSESDRPESLAVLLTVYEYYLNKRKFNQLVDLSRDIVLLSKKHRLSESASRSQKLLIDTAEILRSILLKNKDAEGLLFFSSALSSIYDSFTQIIDESDSRIIQIRYNLAETLFEIKDFSSATKYYRWVSEHGSKIYKNSKINDASIKAIASRYEVLRQKQLIPTKLVAQPVSVNSENITDPSLSEWLTWIEAEPVTTGKQFENFLFESNRALYAQKNIKKAIVRLKKFSLEYQNSEYAIPSASLVIDTYLASSDWKAVLDLANYYMNVKIWKNTPFYNKISEISADVSFKIIESHYESKNYSEVENRVELFLKHYPQSNRFSDCLILAGNTALALKDKEKANRYFTQLIEKNPKNESVGIALLKRAIIHEEKYEFAKAADDYSTYLDLPPSLTKKEPKSLHNIAKKALALAWLSSDSSNSTDILLSRLLLNPKICTDALALECDRYQALSNLKNPNLAWENDNKKISFAFNRARKGMKENRAIWAAISFLGSKKLGFRDRNLLIRQFVEHWDELDPAVQYSILPLLTVSIPKIFERNRLAMQEVAPLRSDERYITRRIEVMHEMENAATQAVKLPWARVRALVLNEMANLYLDFSKEIRTLTPPKNIHPEDLMTYEQMITKLLSPFEEKGRKMRSKAYEIASKFLIEDDSIQYISEPFFKENFLLRKKIDSLKSSLKYNEKLDFLLKYRHNLPNNIPEHSPLEKRWILALENKHWAEVIFYLHDALEKSLFSKSTLGLMRSVSLAQAGAQAEALIELDHLDFNELKISLPNLALLGDNNK